MTTLFLPAKAARGTTAGSLFILTDRTLTRAEKEAEGGKMKSINKLALFLVAAFLAMAVAVFAHEGGNEGDELAEGKELFDSGVSCDELDDEQLEAIGEYLMEQMHPGEAHDLMHKMMGIEEGTPYHDQFHVNLAQAMYCDSNKGTDAPLSTLDGGMMPMMRMMPMLSTMAGQSAQGMMGGLGYGGYGSGYSNLVNVLYIVLLLGLIGLVYFWLLKMWKGKDTKKRK